MGGFGTNMNITHRGVTRKGVCGLLGDGLAREGLASYVQAASMKTVTV